jgi:hypothetical protein
MDTIFNGVCVVVTAAFVLTLVPGVTSLDKLTPDHLSELLDEVITNSTCRANAQKLQRQIVEANGLSVAADVVEKALGITTVLLPLDSTGFYPVGTFPWQYYGRYWK